MGAVGKGIIANLVGIFVIWAAAKGFIIPDAMRDELIVLAGDSVTTLLGVLSTVGLVINQWLIRKAKRETPPIPDIGAQISSIALYGDTTQLKESLDKMPGPGKQAGLIRPEAFVPLFCAAVIILGGILFTGACANMTSGPNQKQNAEIALQLTAQVATMAYIEHDQDKQARHETGQRIAAIADDLVKWLDTNEVSIDALAVLVVDRIDKLQLEPSRRVLAMNLVNYIDSQLSARMADGFLKPEDRASVSALMKAVSTAARAY